MKKSMSDEPTEYCINDQGGDAISITYGICNALRAETHGNNPIVLYRDVVVSKESEMFCSVEEV